MRRLKIWIAAIALLGVLALIGAWMLGRSLRPSAVALLDLLPPDGDVYALIDLEALQSNPAVRRLLADPSGFSPDPSYAEFLTSTEFRYQEDLKQFTLARLGPDWLGVARIDSAQAPLVAYLEREGAARSQLGSRTVFSFGTERPFHLTFLEERLVAFAIGGPPDALVPVLQRHGRSARDSAASELRAAAALDRPEARSEAWFYARLDRLLAVEPGAEPEGMPVGSLRFGREWLQGSRTLYGSVRSTPVNLAVHLEDVCEDPPSARRIAEGLNALLTIIRSIPSDSSEASGADFYRLLDAVSIEQAGESVHVRWRLDPAMLLRLIAARLGA